MKKLMMTLSAAFLLMFAVNITTEAQTIAMDSSTEMVVNKGDDDKKKSDKKECDKKEKTEDCKKTCDEKKASSCDKK